jgi:hypothetical protein
VSSKLSLFLTLAVFGLSQLALSAPAAKETKSNLATNSHKQVLAAVAPATSSAVQSKSVVAAGKQQGSVSFVSVKGFKEWKNEKVQSAIKKVTITKAQIEYKKLNKQIFKKTEAGLGKDIDIEKLESQLKSDLFALDAAQQLGVQDYFAIYLTKLENKNEAFKEAAQKMNSDEVAELINAFADSMVGSQGAPVTAPAAAADSFEDKIK